MAQITCWVKYSHVCQYLEGEEILRLRLLSSNTCLPKPCFYAAKQIYYCGHTTDC